MFLKIYIKVFQHASDLDDSVEEKLLIGDRPKPSNDPDNKLPLEERLTKRKQEEVDDVRFSLRLVKHSSEWPAHIAYSRRVRFLRLCLGIVTVVRGLPQLCTPATFGTPSRS